MACKAGMNNNDRQKINKIITEVSKDSNYYKREQLRSQQATQRAAEMKKKISDFKNQNGGSLY